MPSGKRINATLSGCTPDNLSSVDHKGIVRNRKAWGRHGIDSCKRSNAKLRILTFHSTVPGRNAVQHLGGRVLQLSGRSQVEFSQQRVAGEGKILTHC